LLQIREGAWFCSLLGFEAIASGRLCGKVISRIALLSNAGASAGNLLSAFSIGDGVFAAFAGVEGGSFQPASVLVGTSEVDVDGVEDGWSFVSFMAVVGTGGLDASALLELAGVVDVDGSLLDDFSN
jgi:hypothetical protein